MSQRPQDQDVVARMNALLEEEREFFETAPARFFEAWKRGVRLAGIRFFGAGTEASFQSATSKWDLAPNFELIDNAIGVMSSGEATFIAALYSFYNSQDGGRFLRSRGFEGLSDLSSLDLPRRRVISDLLLNYTGW